MVLKVSLRAAITIRGGLMSYAELTHAELAALRESLEQGIRASLR